VLARAVNELLLWRRKDAARCRFPPKAVTYRGGGLPDQYKSFYQVGKVFRVAGYLATSFSQATAEEFMCMAGQREEPCVLWEIHVDPEGEHSATKRCQHVAYVTHANVPGEEEYLYAPYAPFTVKSVSMYLCMYVCVVACIYRSTPLDDSHHSCTNHVRYTRQCHDGVQHARLECCHGQLLQ
jgi:hypothetical protein